MKKVLFLFSIITVTCFSARAQSFVNPLDFEETEVFKKRVIEFIQKDVKRKYGELGMDDATTLRMMENEELKAFKELIGAENRRLLQKTIDKYCGIGMCDYSTINMMYKEELKAESKSLDW